MNATGFCRRYAYFSAVNKLWAPTISSLMMIGGLNKALFLVGEWMKMDFCSELPYGFFFKYNFHNKIAFRFILGTICYCFVCILKKDLIINGLFESRYAYITVAHFLCNLQKKNLFRNKHRNRFLRSYKIKHWHIQREIIKCCHSTQYRS